VALPLLLPPLLLPASLLPPLPLAGVQQLRLRQLPRWQQLVQQGDCPP
jgi:hypothetical protein